MGYGVPTTTGIGSATHSYDSGDRLTDVTAWIATTYDAFGRTTQRTTTTAGAPGAAKLATVGYMGTDMVAARTLHTGTTTGTGVEASQTWTVDPTGTRFATSTITTGTGTGTGTAAKTVTKGARQ